MISSKTLNNVRLTLLFCLLALASNPLPAGKDTADPTNRIFLVGSDAEWIDTGLFVRPQDYVTIRAGSEVCFSGSSDEACVRAEGWPRATYAEVWSRDAAACADPFPEWNHAALVARVGEEPVLVGKKRVIEGKEGRLFLNVNDCSFDGDHRNQGEFSVVVAVENPVALAARRGREAIGKAIDAMGGKDAIRAVRSLAVKADCSGPGGDFVTEVQTILPDKTLFRQSSEAGSVEWLVVGDKAWRLDREQGKRKSESKKVRETVRGHEYHFTLFEIESRFRNHTLPLESEPLDAAAPTDCKRVEMEDLMGAPAAVCLDLESSLPVRLRFQPAGQKKEAPIEMELESWREINGVQFLESFTLRHGEDVFTYEYETIEPNTVARGVFKEVSERAFAEIRKRAKGRGDPEVPEAGEESEAADDSGDGDSGATGR